MAQQGTPTKHVWVTTVGTTFGFQHANMRIPYKVFARFRIPPSE